MSALSGGAAGRYIDQRQMSRACLYADMAQGAQRRLLLAADSAPLRVVPGNAACNSVGAAAAQAHVQQRGDAALGGDGVLAASLRRGSGRPRPQTSAGMLHARSTASPRPTRAHTCRGMPAALPPWLPVSDAPVSAGAPCTSLIPQNTASCMQHPGTASHAQSAL